MAKSRFFGLFLCAMIPVLQANPDSKTSLDLLLEKLNQEPGYVINFKDVSALEVVKFLSKVADLNFIYDENDLNFNLTILSEDQTNLANVLSAFMQVLRIHNLMVIEDGRNLIIHSNPAIRAMAPIISDAASENLTFIPPFITRVFYIEKGNPTAIANILRPMVSSQAMIEVSSGTRHLIVTDVVGNIQKIAELLLSLDAEQSALEVSSYVAKHNSVASLEPLLKQLIIPLSQGNPLIVVPQIEQNTLYIVTSPYLLKEALTILENIDTPPTVTAEVTGKNILVYQIEQQPHEDLESSIKFLAAEISKNGTQPSNLSRAMSTMRYVPESNSLIFTGDEKSIAALKGILAQFDTAYAKATEEAATSTLYIYRVKNFSPSQLQTMLLDVTTRLEQSTNPDPNLLEALKNVKIEPETSSLVFTGTPGTITKIKELMQSIDVSSKGAMEAGQFYVYTPHARNGQDLLNALNELASNLKSSGLADPIFLKTLSSAKYNPASNTLTFTGDQAALTRIQTLLPALDNTTTILSSSEVFVYKIQNRPASQLQEGLKKLAASLPPGDTVRTVIDRLHYIPESNSLVFSGPTFAINKLKEILPSIDSTGDHPSSSFLIYTPKSHSGESLLKTIKELGETLKASGLADPQFLLTLESATFNPSANAITFTGDQASLARVSSLLPTLDSPIPTSEQSQLFVYPIQNRSKAEIEEGLQNLEGTLPKGDPLRTVLENARYLPESQSFAFRGSPQEIDKIKELLLVLDSKESGAPTYSLYKLKNTRGDLVLRELRQMADHLKASGVKGSHLVQTIDSMRYIKSTNSLYITGTPEAIQEVMRLIPDFDVSTAPAPGMSNFYMYKPKYTTLDKLKTTLLDVAEDFKVAGLEDPALIQTILTLKTVDATQSLLFTGPPEAIARVQELVAGIDTPENAQPIKQIGATTFLIYKLKYVTGPQLTKSLRNIISDLQKTGEPDPDLVKSIEHMRYVPETNSIVFTGTKETLQKVQSLTDKFDVENLMEAPPAPPEGYVVYKPKNLSGEELIQVLHDLEQNLTNSGVEDKDLIDTINNLKWMPKTSTILVSGTAKATAKCVDLLEKFDVAPKTGTAGTSIETIDNTSFLLYKLQYHQGNEIQTALQAISRDVRQNENATTANTLSNTIASIQWLQVTNTLIGSGNAETLDKVRELIKGLDAPLKQVYIEVLVLEISDNNAVTLGLNWRQSGVWRNKLAFTMSNQNPANVVTNDAGTAPLQPFINGVSGSTAVSATTRPNSNTMLPFTTGGDLGIIGDVILHQGTTFFSLSDFITALGVEGTSTIVLNQKLVTQDNQLATLFVGDNLPFTGSLVTTTQASGGTTQAANVEYRDIGVKLNITPRIGDDNVVTLEIDEDITEQINTGGSNSSSVSTTQLGAISSSRRTTQTRITMPDRHFLILSGQVRNTTTRTKSYIPCLGTLPIVGAMFSENDSTKATSNIVIFIRPQILHTTEEYLQITQEQEDLFRNESLDKEAYDAGLELVKTPDDE